MAMKEIQFHITSKENGWLSNFAPYPVELDGKVWPTSEHYYQAQKYLLHDPEYAEKIRSKKYPLLKGAGILIVFEEMIGTRLWMRSC